MTNWETTLGLPGLLAAGAGFFALLLGLSIALVAWSTLRTVRKREDSEAGEVLQKARAEAESILRESKLAANEQALKLLEETEQSFAARRAERAELERRLGEREVLINTQLERVVEAERTVKQQQQTLQVQLEEVRTAQCRLAQQEKEVQARIESLAGLTGAEARDAVLKRAEQEANREAQTISSAIVEKAKAEANERARHVLCTAIQRYAGEHTFQTTTTSVTLAGEDIKGRIIGREGRNIRAFEAATGVTVLIDDTPGAVLLSSFDPVRREIAREAMVRLIQDGRIHPTRIEEIVALVSQETNVTIQKLGEQAVLKAGIAPLAPELVVSLGKLHFRHSYSQNILEHSIEVAHLAGLMAAELGIDIEHARRAGLLHDIGKAVSHELEGPHALVGAKMLKKCGECEPVVNGVASHHNEVPHVGPIGVLISAADAISASRPGARSENMTTYLKRIEDLEHLAMSFPGVEKAFAVHAGRELRIFVQPEAVDDQSALALARGISQKIENDLQYPGQIKIVVIRETRCVEMAK
jgi:ribonuclease Y